MEIVQQLIPLVKPYYPPGDPAHDWPHIGRVVANARLLAQQEKNVNIPCLLAAAYCHDLVNLPKNHPERSQASHHAAKEAGPLLEASGFTKEDVARIQQIIIEHSFSKGLKPSSIEAALLQDADRLDAIGAIGILRCAAVNTLMKSSFYDPFDPLAESRELDDKQFMVDHYFTKLFKLPEMMNTEAARSEASRRVEYMKTFLGTLMKEVRG